MTLPNLLFSNDSKLCGKWASVKSGTCLKSLSDVDDVSYFELWLNEDGTARWGNPKSTQGMPEDKPEQPLRTEWRGEEGRALVLLIPIAPMPEYGIEEWQHDGTTVFDVAFVEGQQLLINDRMFDGEILTLLEKI